MTNEELILFVKRKMRYTKKMYREPWLELLKVLEKEEEYENSPKTKLKRAGISQLELAKLLGIEACTVSLYLSGRRTPPKWFVNKVNELMK